MANITLLLAVLVVVCACCHANSVKREKLDEDLEKELVKNLEDLVKRLHADRERKRTLALEAQVRNIKRDGAIKLMQDFIQKRSSGFMMLTAEGEAIMTVNLDYEKDQQDVYATSIAAFDSAAKSTLGEDFLIMAVHSNKDEISIQPQGPFARVNFNNAGSVKEVQSAEKISASLSDNNQQGAIFEVTNGVLADSPIADANTPADSAGLHTMVADVMDAAQTLVTSSGASALTFVSVVSEHHTITYNAESGLAWIVETD